MSVLNSFFGKRYVLWWFYCVLSDPEVFGNCSGMNALTNKEPKLTDEKKKGGRLFIYIYNLVYINK